MEPITMALIAGSIGTNLIGGQQAKGQAREALAEQMRQFDAQMRFGQAARTDAYGNVVRYDPVLNKWITELTPMQRQVTKAGEREQFMGLTEDAARNREARRRQEKIGKSAAQDYESQSAGFRYGGPPSESAIYDQISRLLANRRAEPNVAQNRLTARMGAPIVTAANAPRGPSSADDALTARKMALDEFMQRQGAHSNRYLPAMKFFAEGAGGGGGAQFGFSDTGKTTGATQDAMAQMIAGIGKSGAEGLLSAGKNLTDATGKQFGTMGADVARILAASRPRGTGGKVEPIASSTSYTGGTSDFNLDDLLAGGVY